jgi:crotonobetainyl-CoA:carnitine CoA-transferase CaiB-like acyl-CoA transferase
MTHALSGLKVIDLSRVLAGPYCSMILGDLGADVIKIEAPGGSDDTRSWSPPDIAGQSAYYLCANRNKRAMTLNLKTEAGREIFRELVKRADILVQNFVPGTMEKWKLSYDQLKPLNPALIYCSVSGFGENGPYKELPGYDAIIQAMGGMMSITGSEESGPMKVGVAISDLAAGLYAVVGILAAVHERARSGTGQKIDISLFDAQISLLANVSSNYLISGEVPRRYGNQHPNIVPYQTFTVKDGEIVVAVGNDKQFKKFCELIDLPHLSQDSKFAANSARLVNRDELIAILSESLRKFTADSLQKMLNESGIPTGPILNLQQLFNDPQVTAREMKVEMPHPAAGSVPLVGSPLKLTRTKVKYERHPPMVGEHTDEILTEYGFTREQIEQWRKNSVI